MELQEHFNVTPDGCRFDYRLSPFAAADAAFYSDFVLEFPRIDDVRRKVIRAWRRELQVMYPTFALQHNGQHWSVVSLTNFQDAVRVDVLEDVPLMAWYDGRGAHGRYCRSLSPPVQNAMRNIIELGVEILLQVMQRFYDIRALLRNQAVYAALQDASLGEQALALALENQLPMEQYRAAATARNGGVLPSPLDLSFAAMRDTLIGALTDPAVPF